LVRLNNSQTTEEFARLLIAGALFALPALIDIVFLTTDPLLIRSVLSFFANLLFWAAFSFVVDSRYFEHYLKWYCWISVLESAIALYAYATMKFPLDFLIEAYGSDYVKSLSIFNINDGFVRLNGTFFDPNFYGIYLVSVIAAALWMYLYKGRSSFYLLLTLVSFVQLIMTTSRTSMLALGGVVIAYVIYRGVATWIVLAGSVVVAIAGTMLVMASPAMYDRLFNSESVNDRLAFFERGINAFLESPIFGGGSESLVDPASGISTAHSVYLSVLGRNGLFGAVSFLFAVAIIMAPIISGRCEGIARRHFAMQVFLFVTIAFVSYDTLYYFEPLYLLFGLMFVSMKIEPEMHGVQTAFSNGDS